MKKLYEDLDLELVRFDAEDVITTSADTCNPDKLECESNCPNKDSGGCGAGQEHNPYA